MRQPAPTLCVCLLPREYAEPRLQARYDRRSTTGHPDWRAGGFEIAPLGTTIAATTQRKGATMKIVVIGGTGLIGSKLVEKLRQARHEPLAASPATGVNTITGE